jgi:error-prone DNA polymerase
MSCLDREEMNYEMYFITVYDIVRFARATRKAGVVAQLPILPCFCLSVTAVDPTE